MGPEHKSILGQVAVAVLIALLAGGTAPWWWDKVFGNKPPPEDEGTGGRQPDPRPGPPPPAPRPEPNQGCAVMIANSLVPLRREPSHFDGELVRVPPGQYQSLEYKRTGAGPSKSGWFKIQVGTRRGWIQDDTWAIASKTDSCP